MRVYSHGCFVSFVVFSRRKKIARPRGRAISFQWVACIRNTQLSSGWNARLERESERIFDG
jgi:hypothetical protein